MKRKLWDVEYESGRWDHCEYSPDAIVYQFICRYCHKGNILDLGCGSGNTGNEIDIASYGSYTGLDISEVAVEKARERSVASGRAGKNIYVQGDILTYEPQGNFDVIAFRESIYYVPEGRIESMLRRYARYLTPSGVFIVLVSGTSADKNAKMLALLELMVTVIEKRSLVESQGFLLVFKQVIE